MKKILILVMLFMFITSLSFAAPKRASINGGSDPTTQIRDKQKDSDGDSEDTSSASSEDEGDDSQDEIASQKDGDDEVEVEVVRDKFHKIYLNELPDLDYDKVAAVAKKFLASKKEKFISPVAKERLKKFKSEYDNPKPSKSIIDLSGLSSRSRIYILTEVLKYKISFLKEYYEINRYKNGINWCNKTTSGRVIKITTLDDFRDKFVISNKYFIKSKGNCLFDDNYPTTFKIGEFRYELESKPSYNQIGNGLLSGITGNGAKWEDLFKVMKGYGDQSQCFDKLSQQRRDGQPIVAELRDKSKFLNGLNLLLDFEVARHLAQLDPFTVIPVVCFLPYIVNIDNFESLLVEKDKISLMAGWVPTRELVARDFKDKKRVNGSLEYRMMPKSSKMLRYKLRALHGPDEDSDGAYSGDEDDLKKYLENEKEEFLNEYGGNTKQKGKSKVNKDLKEKRKVFLRGISGQYITGMRNADAGNGRDVLWGGDLEVQAIADELGLVINIFQPGIDNAIRIEPSNDGDPKEIYLWYADGHFMAYNHSERRIIPIPGDGNCLFNAVITSYMMHHGSLDVTVLELRNQVADRLQVMVDAAADEDDPIQVRFRRIFEARGNIQLEEAVLDLPPGDLLNRAILLLPEGRRELARRFADRIVSWLPSAFFTFRVSR
ncbi:MAG: hypothetical protein KKE11_07235 [Gammaproteobacteria bacterium]|nr:hypothetical protein [Gammaproteobacteria bacterium]